MTVEVRCSEVIENKTVSVNVTEQMESANEAKLLEMKKAVNAFLGGRQQREIEVRASPNVLPPATTSSEKTSPPKSDSPKKITPEQLGYLLKLLKQHKISVKDFCQQYGVNQVEEMLLDDARGIIHDLKNS